MNSRATWRLARYAGLGALGVFVGAQLLPLLMAAGPVLLIAAAAAAGLWVTRRRPSLPEAPEALLARLRFEEAHALARRSGQLAPLHAHLAHALAVPTDELRATLAELYERLSQLELSAEDAYGTHLDRDFRLALREHVQAAFEALWSTCRKLAVVQGQGVALPADHPGLARVRTQIDDLLGATRDVQRAVVELSLSRGEQRLEEAGLALRVARRQADTLRSLERLP